MDTTQGASIADRRRYMAVVTLLAPICFAASVFGMSSTAFAQADYPTRTIKIIVPLPAGPITLGTTSAKNSRRNGLDQ